MFNESDHPRRPAGNSHGGEFGSKVPKYIEDKAKKIDEPGRFDEFDGHKFEVLTNKKAVETFQKNYGKNLSEREIINLSGGIVEKDLNGKIAIEKNFITEDNSLLISISSNKYFSRRYIYPDGTIVNDELIIKPEFRKQGLGTKLLFNQQEQASKLGFKKISLIAGGENGYYSWARLGFQMSDKDNQTFKRVLPAKFKETKNVNELVSTKAGAAWWDNNGFSWHGEFDLTEGSLSKNILNKVVKAKFK